MCRDKRAFVEAEILRFERAVEAIHRAEIETAHDEDACEILRMAYIVTFKHYAAAANEHMLMILETAKRVSPLYYDEVRRRLTRSFEDMGTDSPLSEPVVPEDWIGPFREEWDEGREG